MLPESSVMGIDSSTSLSWPTSHRRVNLTPAKLRLKEERKRIIRALDAKYTKYTTDDCERGMRRYVLIQNNLRRLQREAREEKLARNRANMAGSKVSNLSPSCLSATRPRSPSPPCDYGYAETNSPPFTDGGTPLFEGDDPPPKRQRLFFDDEKESEMEVDENQEQNMAIDDSKIASTPNTCSSNRPVDDAQEILRELYETCVSEGVAQRTSCTTPYPNDAYSSPPQQQTSYSLFMSASCSLPSSINNSSSCNSGNSCENDWTRHSQYHYNCGHSSLLGNDLQSVVFHSLITSLES